MADTKLTALAELVTVVSTDIFYVVDDPGGTPLSKKVTQANILAPALLAAGTRALTGNWDAGSFSITAETLHSDVATGTAPLSVASTTLVANFNADQVDGKDATDLLLLDGTQAMSGALNMGTNAISAVTTLAMAGNLTNYEAVNDANPEFRIGSADAEELHIQAIYNSATQVLSHVLFQTDTSDVGANKGLFRFNVDGTDILDIDDGGIDLNTGLAFSINGTDVLNSTALGSTVVGSVLTSVGILGGGSIAAGFGNIDNGTSNITTGGILKLDVDGTAENAVGSLTLGLGNDAGIFFDGTDLVIITNGAGGFGIKLDAENDTVEILGSGVLQATFSPGGLNLVAADAYSIAGTSVLNATTLGTTVVGSSLTSVGTLTGLTMGGNIVMADNSVTGIDTLTFTDVNGTIASIENQNLVDKSATETIAGDWIFTGVLTIPQSATPVVDANGEIAMDTTVTDWVGGLIRFFNVAEQAVVAMPVAEFTTPADGAVPTYVAANDQFEMAVPSGSGDVTAAANFGTDNVLIRSDGTLKGVQFTGITVADTSNNMSGIGTLTMGGNIIMGDASVTGIDTLTFTDVNGTIAGIENQNLTDKSATETIAGDWIFTGVLTIPQSATPVVDADGEFALDTLVTDFTGGVLKYWSGELFGIVAMPIAEFVDVDGGVPTYNATTNDFELVVPAGSGDVTAAAVMANNTIVRGDGGAKGVQDSGITIADTTDNVSGMGTLSLGGDITLYEALNDGNPELRIGSSDAEEVHIQTVYDSVAQTLDFVRFQTDVVSGTADKGRFIFNVDGTDRCEIDDGGVDLPTGNTFSINSAIVLSNDTLGTLVVNSSLTSVGTIATGTWQGTTIAVDQGGTGDTTYTNGQLLIGNTTGNTLTKAVLTPTTNQINIVNSTGSITLSTPQDIHTGATPQFARLGLGTAADGTDVLNLPASGNIVVAGANPKRSITIMAPAMWPSTTNGAAALAKTELGTNNVDFQSLDFDTTTIEFAQFAIIMPDNWDASTITFKAMWTAASGTGTVLWEIQAVSLTNSDAMDTAFPTAVGPAADTLLTANDLHETAESGAVTITNATAGEYVQFRIQRDTAGDTLTADAKLLGIRIEYGIDAYGH